MSQGRNYRVDGIGLAIFGCTIHDDLHDGWVMGSTPIRVEALNAKERIESALEQLKARGHSDEVDAIMVNPVVACDLYAQGVLKAANFEDAMETCDSVMITAEIAGAPRKLIVTSVRGFCFVDRTMRLIG